MLIAQSREMREHLQDSSKNEKDSKLTSSLGFDYEEMPTKKGELAQIDTS
jgi:hypothetical protein